MREWFKQWWQQITDRLKDRTADPFLGMLTLTFIVVNWRFVFVLIKSGSSDLASALELAGEQLKYPEGIVYPICISAGYIVVYPFIRLIVFFIQTIHKNLELLLKKIEYVKPEVIQAMKDEISQKESKFRDFVFKNYAFFLKDSGNQNVNYRFARTTDDSITPGNFYIEDNGVLKKPRLLSKQKLICYIVDRVDNDSVIFAYVPSNIPLPPSLIDSREDEYYLTEDDKITKTPTGHERKVIIKVRRLDDKRAVIEYM